jgi:hypothetical protein
MYPLLPSLCLSFWTSCSLLSCASSIINSFCSSSFFCFFSPTLFLLFQTEYAPDEASPKCYACAVGEYTNSSGLGMKCFRCPPGTRRGPFDFGCQDCTPGRFSNQWGAESCRPCTLGRYMPDGGATDCSDCSAGFYQDVEGSDFCSSCDFGRYASQPGSFGCQVCPRGLIANSTGSVLCTPCEVIFPLPSFLFFLMSFIVCSFSPSSS